MFERSTSQETSMFGTYPLSQADHQNFIVYPGIVDEINTSLLK